MLTAHAGEVLALAGPNGAGTSTLWGALAADVPTTGVPAAEGVVRVHGRPVSAWSAPEPALCRAVLPQSASLSFPFPVEEVVRMGRAPRADGDRADEDDAVVAGVVGRTEVTGFAGRVCAEELLSEVHDQPVEVLPHPRTGALLVLPRREP